MSLDKPQGYLLIIGQSTKLCITLSDNPQAQNVEILWTSLNFALFYQSVAAKARKLDIKKDNIHCHAGF